MSQYIISGATSEDIGQLAEKAADAGLDMTQVTWNTMPDGTIIVYSDLYTELELAAVSVVDPAWRPKLAPALITHAGHLLAFRDAVRDGSQALKTQAQRASELEHVVADICDYIRLVDDRL